VGVTFKKEVNYRRKRDGVKGGVEGKLSYHFFFLVMSSEKKKGGVVAKG
jgi:hypothetical protein